MKFDYLLNIEELQSLYQTVTNDDCAEVAYVRCIKYGRCLEKLIRYIYSKEFPNYRAASSELIKLIKDKKFKQFLGRTDYYNKLHFTYLAGNNAAFDHDIDMETAELAFENLKETTYHVFRRLGRFDEEQQVMFEYIPKSACTISEAKTRELYIDTNLKSAGYSVLKEKNKIVPGKVGIEIEVFDLPNQANGFADYVIYNNVGLPVAVIEAKRTSISEEAGAQQAKDYADALVKNLNLKYRPIVYYTNGYVIKIQDRLGYPARQVGNFASLDDLELLIKRQLPGVEDKRNPIADKTVDANIIDRSKLIEAVKEMIDSMNTDGKMRRKGLLVLPCGVGKTRTAVALSKILIKNDWVQNVLFLADRNNLVTNALKPFSNYIEGGVSDISAENPDRDTNARVCICTYNSMLNFLNKPKKEFSVGHFDMIIVDEAHRSLFNVYRAIFEYFDSFVIGLTATPSKAIDRSTYEILNLNTDEPTFEVKFEEAVNLEYLVSYRAFDKTSNILKNGLKYSDLTDKEKEEYEELFGNADGTVPEHIEGSAFRKHIFNNDTIDKMFSDLFANGLRIENGNKLGKTLIFAVDHKHAVSIVERFKVLYPNLGDEFCQVIDNQIKKNKTRQENFAKKNSNPQIVVSVDMMDTGVDIPEIVNLVFFKRVLSRIKFDQMWGRGTRTCKNLYVISPSRDYFEDRTKDDTQKEYVDKQGFYVFDYCNNFEFFELHPEGHDPSNMLNLNQKIYSVHLDMLSKLQSITYQEQTEYKVFYNQLKKLLVEKISALDMNRIDVKLKQYYVDKYKTEKAFSHLSDKNIYEIKTNLLKLIEPDTMDDNYSKSLDYRVCVIQLSLLDDKVDSVRQQQQLMKMALALLEKASIQDIFDKREILKKLADEKYYDKLDFFELEKVKMEVGPLVKYLRGEDAGLMITNFNDKIETKVRDARYDFDNFKTYREKIITYLQKHFGELISVQKIIRLDTLTHADLEELQNILDSLKNTETDAGEEFENAQKLIIFVRKIIGLEKKTIDEKCAKFLNLNNFNREQRQMINLIIDFAIRNGNVTTDDLVNTEPFSDIEIPELFDNELEPILQLVAMFTNPLTVAA
ncbi:MAG: DEAD/DEAH box helicase family protein [Roseburia sp.]|nr:DEAD/DEAH box helicase family protein [Roseburia sp.]